MYSSKAHSLHVDVSQLSLTMEESLAPREAVRICWPKCFDTEEKLCFCSSAVSSSLWGLSRASVEDDRGLLTPYITDIVKSILTEETNLVKNNVIFGVVFFVYMYT